MNVGVPIAKAGYDRLVEMPRYTPMLHRIALGLLFAAGACSCTQMSKGAADVAAEPPTDSSPSPQSVRRVGDKIFIVGELNPQIAAEFIHDLDTAVHSLVITSGGGYSTSAIEIGRAVHQRGLRVVVAKACFSGCAHFVFAAARERVILPNSLVIFHNTRSSIARLGARLGSSETDDFQRAVDADAALEQEFYAELGLPSALLYEPQIEVNTICVRFARDSAGRVRDLEFKSTYAGWVPTREFLTKARLPFSGFWPDSPLTF